MAPTDTTWSGTEFREASLNRTNYWRAQYHASPVKWDTTLATYAHTHSKQCLWKHSGGPYGENLALGFSNPKAAIDAWANEAPSYDYSTATFSEAAGHFTQLVWKGTTHVGCGAVKCDDKASGGAEGWYFTCEYSPPGNVIGYFKENVGRRLKTRDDDDGEDGELVKRSGVGRVKSSAGVLAVWVMLLVSFLMNGSV